MRIRTVHFEGNTHFTDRQLRAIIALKEEGWFEQDQANADSRTIMEYYQRDGWFNISVEYPRIEIVDSRQVDVYFTVHEFGRMHADSLVFRGNRLFSDYKLREMTGMGHDQPVPVKDISSAIYQIPSL